VVRGALSLNNHPFTCLGKKRKKKYPSSTAEAESPAAI